MFRCRRVFLSIVVAIGLMLIGKEARPSQEVSKAYALTCGINCLNSTNAPTAVVPLTGIDQTANYTLTLSVNSTLNLGWNVTITSTQFDTTTTPTRTLPTSASSITGVTEVCTSGQVCVSNPQNSVTYPVAIPAGSTEPAAAKFYNAQALSGVGTFDLSATIAIAIPANAYAGTYSSTITLAYVSGP